MCSTKSRETPCALLLLLLLRLLPPTPASADLGIGGDPGHEWNDNVLTITADGTYIISGDGDTSPKEQRVLVRSGLSVDVTLDGVEFVMSDSSGGPAFDIEGNSTVFLRLSNSNSVTGEDDVSGNTYAGFHVPYDATLSISGGGELTINMPTASDGAWSAAAIGGNGYQDPSAHENDAGKIIINGGTITAHGAPGIGDNNRQSTLVLSGNVSVDASVKAANIALAGSVTLQSGSELTIPEDCSPWLGSPSGSGSLTLVDGAVLTNNGTINVYPGYTISGAIATGSDRVYYAPTIHSPASIPLAYVREPYDLEFTATGDTPITWTTDGDLPNGLTVTSDDSSLDISGEPNVEAGSYSFTLKASNDVYYDEVVVPLEVLPDVPLAPTITSATPQKDAAEVTLAAVTWRELGGARILSYDVELSCGADGSSTRTLAATPHTEPGVPVVLSLLDMREEVSYDLRVRAWNSVDSSDWSDWFLDVVPLSHKSTPGAPKNVVATPGNESVTVSFDAPLVSEDTPILSFSVTMSHDSTLGAPVTLPAAASSYVASSLTNGTAYQFKVAAENERGIGTEQWANTVTPATVPGKPLNVTAVSGDTKAIVRFDKSASDGGSAITEYVVTAYRQPDNVAVKTAYPNPKTGTSATVSGLSNGVSYVLAVHAVNEIGPGEDGRSNTVTPERDETLPGPPQNVKASAGNTRAAVMFEAPESAGSSPITEYVVTAYQEDGLTPVEATVSPSPPSPPSPPNPVVKSPATVSGLTNGTAYLFAVYAINANGEGAEAWTDAVTPKPSTVPGPPQNVTAEAGNAAATVTFAPPSYDGGSAIIEYVVTAYKQPTNVADKTTSLTPPASESATVTGTVSGLTNGTAYKFAVQAVNANGANEKKAWANEQAAVTPAEGVVDDNNNSQNNSGDQGGGGCDADEAAGVGVLLALLCAYVRGRRLR
ncbi:MAG: fibronectin type III domain-containing protein [Synergistaceae bacterium]|nr:fibronectin type III domain-containing protein [Synergistaceae bacterium]